MIYVIGDSHVSIFTGTNEIIPVMELICSQNYSCCRVGPATAYAIYYYRKQITEIITNYVKEEDKVLFSFGEVDIRAHIAKEYLKDKTKLGHTIKDVVDEYFKTILFYKSYGIDIGIWAPIASHRDPMIDTEPTYGTNYERNLITKTFNYYLESCCKIHKIPFFSIFDYMLMEDGTTNSLYLNDYHLNINSLGLINKIMEM